MDSYTFSNLRDLFLGRFQPRIVYRPAVTGDGNGNVAVSGDPTKMWVRDRVGGNPYRVNAGLLTTSLAEGTPITVGATLGYDDKYSEAKQIFNPAITSPTGMTGLTAYLPFRAIGYGDSANNMKGDASKLEFFESSAQGVAVGTQAAWIMDTYSSTLTNGSFFGAHLAEGTVSSPSAISSGHLLLYFGVRTYGASAFSSAYNGRLRFLATQNHTNSARGVRGIMAHSDDGATTETDEMQWDSNGTTVLRAFNAPITTVTTDTTLTVSHYTVLADATSNNITLTLPAAAGVGNRLYNIKRIDASANTVTIDANGSETIDGSLTQVITTQYTALALHCDATAWWLI